MSCTQKNCKLRKRSDKIKKSDEETQAIKLQPIEILKDKEFLSIEEAGLLLGVSKRTLYRLIKKEMKHCLSILAAKTDNEDTAELEQIGV